MASEASICSQALLLLGDRPIANLADEGDRAILCNQLWADTRDWVIRMHPWNSCIKRLTLSPLAAAPAFEWGYQFQLPADCLRVLSVGQEGEFIRYKLEGRNILVNDSVVELRYLFRNEDPGTYDPGLIEVFARAMAAKLAYPITKSTSAQEAMESLLSACLKRAKAVDGQEDVPDDSASAPLIAVRSVG